jgi:uncharacterized protein YxeA
MKKKIIIVAILVVVIIGIAIFVIGRGKSSSSNEVTNTETTTETQASNSTESDDVTSTDDAGSYEQDRELKFNNKVTINKDGTSYVTGSEDVTSTNVEDIDIVDKYEFSNGFILQSTDNLRLMSYGFDEGALICDVSGARVTVTEVDPESMTVQELRKDALSAYNFDYYLGCTPSGITLDAEVEVGNGLTDYESYFEMTPYRDPTVEDNFQLLCDTTVDTAFGGALYIEVYNSYSQTYNAYAYIQCDKNRILSISIEDTIRDNLWSYLIEVTNDGITLVE